MSETKAYRCVNCGEPAAALYKTYGPAVLKLSKCEQCKGVVDKYIEYDPVIVMIDLVLMSKEAQRHVLYNTEFKFFWKVLMLTSLLETFGVWSADSLFSVAVYSLCHIHSNLTSHAYLEVECWMPEGLGLRAGCRHWAPPGPATAAGGAFIWEKEFYIHFMATTAGLVVFIAVVHWSLSLASVYCSREPVPSRPPLSLSLRLLSLGACSGVLSAPALVWAAKAGAGSRALRHAIVAGYCGSAHATLVQVVSGCGWLVSVLVVLLGSGLRLLTVYHSLPALTRLFLAMQ